MFLTIYGVGKSQCDHSKHALEAASVPVKRLVSTAIA